MTTPELHTERLRLFLSGPEMAPQMLAFHIRNRDHLEPWGPPMPDELFQLEWWERSAARVLDQWGCGTAVRFTLCLHDQNEVVGTAAIFGIRRQHWQICELAFGLDAARQGQGLMTEAARAVLRFAFDELALHRVSATHRSDNQASRRVLKRLGFQEEGCMREHASFQGRRYNQSMMGLLSGEFAR
jgi:[ribosomal protein S5]-alanine N-acetyltransferase